MTLVERTRISLRWKHSSGHIVEELCFFNRISDGVFFYYGDMPTNGKPSLEGSMPLEKIESVKLLKVVS